VLGVMWVAGVDRRYDSFLCDGMPLVIDAKYDGAQ
jgi:hypothetical protein